MEEEHYDKFLSLKTYKAHRRLHYDAANDKWSRREAPADFEDRQDTVVARDGSPPQAVGLIVSHDFSFHDGDPSFEGTLHVALWTVNIISSISLYFYLF